MSVTTEEAEKWQAAVDEEFKSLETKRAWDRDIAPEPSSVFATHIVLKFKRGADGIVGRFRDRVVAGENFQVYEQDYFETYAPVVSFDLVRIHLDVTLLKN